MQKICENKLTLGFIFALVILCCGWNYSHDAAMPAASLDGSTLVAHGPMAPPDPWDSIAAKHGPMAPPDPWDSVAAKHGPMAPPDPWDSVAAKHGPMAPPDPWDSVKAV